MSAADHVNGFLKYKASFQKDPLAAAARDSNHLDAFKTIHEAAHGYDETASVADALDLDSVYDDDISRSSAHIAEHSRKALEHDNFPEEFTVYRKGDISPNQVVSVSTRPLRTFSDASRYRVRRNDVLTYGEGVQKGQFNEHELHVDTANLRPE